MGRALSRTGWSTVIGMAVVACSAEPAGRQASVTPAPTQTAPVPTVTNQPTASAQPPPAPSSDPLRAVDGSFTATPPPKLTLFARSSIGASLSPDGKSAIMAASGRGATLRTGKTTQRIKVGYVTASKFNADGTRFALATEAGNVKVFQTSDGKLLRTVRGSRPIAFVDAKTIAFKRRCEGFVAAVNTQAPPKRLGKACGRLIHTSADYKSWLVAEHGRFRYGVLYTYRKATWTSLPDGRETVLIQATDKSPFLEPVMAKNGARLCFLDGNFSLHCLETKAPANAQRVWPLPGKPLLVGRDDPRVLRGPKLDESGSQLLFRVGTGEHSPHDVYVADFQANKVRRVTHSSREWWSFLPGGKRIVGHGGTDKLVVYDLVRNVRTDIGKPGEEWEGLSVFPGDDTRFVIGKERGGTRDLYLVELS